jgi:hypothetical protein
MTELSSFALSADGQCFATGTIRIKLQQAIGGHVDACGRSGYQRVSYKHGATERISTGFVCFRSSFGHLMVRRKHDSRRLFILANH